MENKREHSADICLFRTIWRILCNEDIQAQNREEEILPRPLFCSDTYITDCNNYYRISVICTGLYRNNTAEKNISDYDEYSFNHQSQKKRKEIISKKYLRL
jgi:hypothetical protein